MEAELSSGLRRAACFSPYKTLFRVRKMTRSAKITFLQMGSERGGWGEAVVVRDSGKNTVPEQFSLAVARGETKSSLASDFQV